MALTQAQVDELEAARATGAREIEFADRRIAWRSLDELDRIIANAKRQLSTTSTRHIRVMTDGGF